MYRTCINIIYVCMIEQTHTHTHTLSLSSSSNTDGYTPLLLAAVDLQWPVSLQLLMPRGACFTARPQGPNRLSISRWAAARFPINSSAQAGFGHPGAPPPPPHHTAPPSAWRKERERREKEERWQEKAEVESCHATWATGLFEGVGSVTHTHTHTYTHTARNASLCNVNAMSAKCWGQDLQSNFWNNKTPQGDIPFFLSYFCSQMFWIHFNPWTQPFLFLFIYLQFSFTNLRRCRRSAAASSPHSQSFFCSFQNNWRYLQRCCLFWASSIFLIKKNVSKSKDWVVWARRTFLLLWKTDNGTE